jgi:hypothetical protein
MDVWSVRYYSHSFSKFGTGQGYMLSQILFTLFVDDRQSARDSCMLNPILFTLVWDMDVWSVRYYSHCFSKFGTRQGYMLSQILFTLFVDDRQSARDSCMLNPILFTLVWDKDVWSIRYYSHCLMEIGIRQGCMISPVLLEDCTLKEYRVRNRKIGNSLTNPEHFSSKTNFFFFELVMPAVDLQ